MWENVFRYVHGAKNYNGVLHIDTGIHPGVKPSRTKNIERGRGVLYHLILPTVEFDARRIVDSIVLGRLNHIPGSPIENYHIGFISPNDGSFGNLQRMFVPSPDSKILGAFVPGICQRFAEDRKVPWGYDEIVRFDRD